MKTDSLRIGNYVLCAGKVIAVTSVFPKGINAHTDRITGKDNLYVDRAVDKFYISIGRLGERVCQVRFVHQLQNILSDGWGVELKLRR